MSGVLDDFEEAILAACTQAVTSHPITPEEIIRTIENAGRLSDYGNLPSNVLQIKINERQ